MGCPFDLTDHYKIGPTYVKTSLDGKMVEVVIYDEGHALATAMKVETFSRIIEDWIFRDPVTS